MSMQTALLDLLSDLGIKEEEVIFRRRGKIAYIKCPFHRAEKTPSMRIVPGLNYSCYGCGATGNVRDNQLEITWGMIQRRLEDEKSSKRALSPEDDIPF